MKKKFSKIISLLLVLASLISLFTVFAYAESEPAQISDTETGGGSGSEEGSGTSVDLSAIELIYKRDFEEGWDYNNGFGAISNHNAYIDYEETATYKYNYFWRLEASASASAGVSSMTIGALRESGSVVQFKIKADDACNVGRIMYMTTAGGKTVSLLYISGTSLYAFVSGNPAYKICDLSNEWITVKMVFDWDATKTVSGGGTDTLFSCRVYYGDNGDYFDYTADYELSKDVGMKTLAIGFAASSADREGMSFCIDDLQIYQKVKEPLDLSGVEEYGSKINPLAAIVVDVQDGPGNKSTEQIINEALCMKVGVDSALIKNVKQSIAEYCTPEIVDGNVMVPLSLFLDFINYPYYIHGESYDITTGTSATYITIGRDTANVDGERIDLSVAPGYLTNAAGEQIPVIAAADIPRIFPGWLLAYDDMGLIIIYSGEASEDGEALIHRDTDLDVMLTIMKKFVFDTVTKDENGKDFDEVEDSYIATGAKVIEDVKNNSSVHPYIFANQDKFDNLNAIYTATENADEVARGYLETLVNKADEIYSEYALIDETTGAYLGIKADKIPVNVYDDGINPDGMAGNESAIPDTTDGYTPQGNLESVKIYSDPLVDLAFAYQVTGDAKYAELAYDISYALSQWRHWGPGDIQNCAAATGNFAIAFDWLYNYYVAEKGQDAVDALAAKLYQNGVKQGYNSSAGISCQFPRSVGGGDVYTTLNTYLNAFCSSNMIIGALALVGYDSYLADSSFLIGSNIQYLIANGLDQYAPDGSYAESALMWAQATNGFVKLIMALESAAGTTYGFEDTWGLDKTFYFACYIEDSDGKIWNYHEGGADGVVTGDILGIDTQMFNYAGRFLNDNTLIAIRKNQLEKGKAVTMFDMLFYPDGDVELEEELSLDYLMSGIHAFVSRSDWDDGALYTGLMGGSNDVYGGQLDSGNFIYRNEGVDWIVDLGSDNSEIYSYNGAYRNHHYRNNAEGQNVILVNTAQAALPYGQLTTGNGKITQTYSNEFGGYAILENKSAYGSTASYANRGLLVTNDRKTVVIQDEVSFPKFQELTWIAHTAAKIDIDETGTVAYLTGYDADGGEHILRATLVSSGEYTFKTEKADANLLDATYKNNDYKTNGGVYPYSRSEFQRLVINTKNVLTFNAAVVFEMVESTDDTTPVGYTWDYMTSWVPQQDGGADSSAVAKRDDAVKSDIIDEVIYLETYADLLGTAYTSDIDAFFRSLTKIAYTLKTYPVDTLVDLYMDSYNAYADYLNDYERYSKNINKAISGTINLTHAMTGFKTGK